MNMQMIRRHRLVCAGPMVCLENAGTQEDRSRRAVEACFEHDTRHPDIRCRDGSSEMKAIVQLEKTLQSSVEGSLS